MGIHTKQVTKLGKGSQSKIQGYGMLQYTGEPVKIYCCGFDCVCVWTVLLQSNWSFLSFEFESLERPASLFCCPRKGSSKCYYILCNRKSRRFISFVVYSDGLLLRMNSASKYRKRHTLATVAIMPVQLEMSGL